MEKIIVIGGCTGSGKSDLSIKIASTLNTEIISADSMQIYRGMNIGTAKVTTDEMAGIPHHMLDIVNPMDTFSVSQYVSSAREIITALNNSGKVPIIVGGTGLYIDALLYDFDFNNASIDLEYREYLQNLAIEHGNEYLHEMLRSIDEEEADKVHANNVKRVIRALEIYHSTGHVKSASNKTLRYDTLMLIKDVERSILYDNIDKRVDKMIDMGLINEIKSLLDSGLTFDMQSMQAIGYREWREYFSGDCSLDELIDNIKKDSRHYAKRQITWFYNKYKDFAHLINNNDIDLAIDMAKVFCKEE